MTWNNAVKSISILVTLGVLCLIIYTIDIKKFIIYQANLSWSILLFASLAYICSLSFRTLRFFIILDRLSSISLRPAILFPIVLVHNFYNRMLPLRTGEVSFILLLKSNMNYDTRKGVFGLVFARLYDGISIFFCLLLGLIYLQYKNSYYALIIIFLSLFLITLLFLIRASFFLSILHQVITFFVKEKWLGKKWNSIINDHLIKIRHGTAKLSRTRDVLPLLFISLAIWFSIYFLFFILLVGYALIPFTMVGYWQVVTGSTLSIITFYLPINFLSGPMEIGWMIGFSLTGMDKKIALASGFGINWFVHILSTLLALSAFLWMGIRKYFLTDKS